MHAQTNGIIISGKMRDIRRALHEQKRIHGGKTTVGTWIQAVKVFPQVNQKFVGDLSGK